MTIEIYLKQTVVDKLSAFTVMYMQYERCIFVVDYCDFVVDFAKHFVLPLHAGINFNTLVQYLQSLCLLNIFTEMSPRKNSATCMQYMLQVKIEFRLKLFNLGWFSIKVKNFNQNIILTCNIYIHNFLKLCYHYWINV